MKSVTYEISCRTSELYTLNRFMKKELVQRGASESKITLLPNGVDALPQSAASETTSANLKASLGIAPNAFVVGYIGAVTEYEGLDVLVQALANLRSRRVHVLIVGGQSPLSLSGQRVMDPLADQLKQLAQSLGVSGKISFTGRVPHEEVPAYFGLIDAAVIPRKPLPVCELVSPLKPLEYLAWGKPIIASDVAPMVDLLRGGELGWLYAKGDANALADAIQKLMATDPAEIQRRCELGKRVVQEQYRWYDITRCIVKNID